MVRLIAGVLLMVAMAPLHASQGDAIDAIVRDEMAAQRIPGMAVAVIRRGDIVKSQGYGLANVEHNVAVTPQTIFHRGPSASSSRPRRSCCSCRTVSCR